MTKVHSQQARRIQDLKNFHRWSVRRIAEHMQLCESTVRNSLKSIDRAMSERHRVRDASKIDSRRAIVEAIARANDYEVVEGRTVCVGRKHPSIGCIASEYAEQTGEEISPSTTHRDLGALGIKSVIRPRVVNNDPTKNSARLRKTHH